MIRRLSIFLIGVLLGVIIVRFAFPGRFTEYVQYFNLDYRVIYHLQQDTIYMGPNASCKLECLSINQDEILQVLHGGEVNFKKSITDAEPCKIYTLEKENISAIFELCKDKVRLQDFTIDNDTCSCPN
jgi:hypothetical protein